MRKVGNFYSFRTILSNLFLLLTPMLYLIFLFTATFNKSNSFEIGVVSCVTFLIYVLIHVGTYKLFKNHNYANKLRVQVMLTNLGFQSVIFAIAMANTAGNAFGMVGLITASICWIILTIWMMYLQSKEYRGLTKALSQGELYESLVILLSVTFIVFLICQLYILWATWYVFVPITTGSIMLATIYKNGVIHEESESPLNLFAVIPVLWGIGLISLACQFFFSIVLGLMLWKLILLALGAVGLVIVCVNLYNRYERYAGMVVVEEEMRAEK